jgi:predicted histidine transporter YuiF (NhaC family)
MSRTATKQRIFHNNQHTTLVTIIFVINLFGILSLLIIFLTLFVYYKKERNKKNSTMGDDDFVIESTDAGASATIPMEAGQIKKGG